MKRNLTIGSKINDWAIVSGPNVIKGKRHLKLKCGCGNEKTFSESYINKSFFSKSCRSCSQIKRRNELGNRKYSIDDVFMNLKIKQIYHKPLVYVVECLNCHHEYRTGHSVLNKKSKGLGLNCCHNCFDVKMKSKKRSSMMTKNISLTKFKTIKNQAELRGIEFKLTPEYLESIYNGFCYFSRLDIIIGTHSKCNNIHDLGNASLDRLNSNDGYVEGNVVWVHKVINLMKNSLNSDEFINMCKIVAHQNVDSEY